MATAPGYADVSVQMSHALLGRSAYITFGCNPSGTDVATMATGVNLAINTTGSLKSIVDSNVSFKNIHVRFGVDGQEDLSYDFQSAVVGQVAQSSLPPNVALLVYKRTARGGRRGRGRLYIPWAVITGEFTEDGLIQTAQVAVKQTAMEVFRGALASNDMPMCVLHRPSSLTTQHPTPQGNPDPVTGLAVANLLATQRRRLGRR